MLDKDKKEVLSDFFLYSAKIIFASLVVGVFVPGAAGEHTALTFSAGAVGTVLFLCIAVIISKEKS